jgi:hypothetical protein
MVFDRLLKAMTEILGQAGCQFGIKEWWDGKDQASKDKLTKKYPLGPHQLVHNPLLPPRCPEPYPRSPRRPRARRLGLLGRKHQTSRYLPGQRSPRAIVAFHLS